MTDADLAAAEEWMQTTCPHRNIPNAFLKQHCPECHAELLAVVREASDCYSGAGRRRILKALATLDGPRREKDG